MFPAFRTTTPTVQNHFETRRALGLFRSPGTLGSCGAARPTATLATARVLVRRPSRHAGGHCCRRKLETGELAAVRATNRVGNGRGRVVVREDHLQRLFAGGADDMVQSPSGPGANCWRRGLGRLAS